MIYIYCIEPYAGQVGAYISYGKIKYFSICSVVQIEWLHYERFACNAEYIVWKCLYSIINNDNMMKKIGVHR